MTGAVPPTPYWSADRRTYLPLPPHVPERFAAALPALRTYTARSLGREHPDGRRDSAGRWYASPDEWRPCCVCVRAPSRRWPLSSLHHCRTDTHAAHLHGVAPRTLRGLLVHIVRYYRRVGGAPWLCPQCGASWACAHVPATGTLRYVPPDGLTWCAPGNKYVATPRSAQALLSPDKDLPLVRGIVLKHRNRGGFGDFKSYPPISNLIRPHCGDGKPGLVPA